MALPGMDLQSQYNQTLQNTIGQSQAERLRQTRQQQSIANTDWQQRGVGEGAKRMAGFQEINPSAMPNMSDETRSFIQPLLGNYQEGGKQVEGYYGSDNPYTQGGLESLLSKQGYARAPSSLGEQFKSVGLKLPNAFGQDYYNAQHEDYGNKIQQYNQQKADYDTRLAEYNRQVAEYSQQQQAKQAEQQKIIDDLYSRITSSTADYQNRYGPGLESLKKYVPMGFIPGKNNGDWQWYSRDPIPQPIQVDEMGTPYGSFEEPSLYEKGSGYWLHSNGSPRGVTYSPSIGIGESDFDHKATGFNRLMPALTMTALGGMFGAAGGLIGGAGMGGTVGSSIGAAIPSTLQTGFSSGDWGKALETGGLAALGGGLAGMYGGDLGSSLGLSGKLGTSVGKGLISGAVNTAGNALLGNKLDYGTALANTLSTVAGPYLGDLTKNAVGGSGGDILGGAVGGFSGNALKNILQGKSLDIGTALSTLQGATGGLGKLFSNTNEDKQSVNGPTSLARTLQGVKNGPAATSRRT